MSPHVLFRSGIRRLGRKESGFFYRYPDSGETVREERVLERIERLKVPPAWREARIARSPRAKVQAVGYDASGKVQYLYSEAYRRKKEQEKYERILAFAGALPRMRRTTSAHLRRKDLDREKVLAAMVRLINAAYFRVGGERYAKSNKTYGIVTLRRKHLTLDGDTMTFDYRGKWGKHHHKVVADRRLSQVVRECAGLPGYRIFKYLDEGGEVRLVRGEELNEYVREVMGGPFTAKDFRTWAGTLTAAVRLAELGASEDEKLAKKNVLAALDAAAENLGNTREMARSSYVNPKVIEHYLEGSVIAAGGARLEEVIRAEQDELSEPEKALLSLLNRRLKSELGEAA